jgi:hypothetical protein
MALEVKGIDGRHGWYIGATAARVLWIAWREQDCEQMLAAFRKACARTGMASPRDELDELARQGVRIVGTKRDYLEHRAKLIGAIGGEPCQG